MGRYAHLYSDWDETEGTLKACNKSSELYVNRHYLVTI